MCREAIPSRLANLHPCRDTATPKRFSTRVNNSVVGTGGPGKAVPMPKTFSSVNRARIALRKSADTIRSNTHLSTAFFGYSGQF